VLRVVRDILYFRPRRRGTDVARALEFAARVLHRRAVAFLVSDFLVPLDDPDLRRALEIGSRRHDLVGVHVTDPRERELPDVGRVALEDAETGDLLEVDTSDPAAREAWARAAADRRSALLHRLRGAGLDTLELDTAVSYMPALLRFFRQRAARQR